MKPLDSLQQKLCQLQARIFEASVDHYACSSAVFIRRFMNSELALTFDDMSYLLMANTVSDVFTMLDEQYGTSSYGNLRYSQEVMYWIGDIYRCLCLKHSLSSRKVYRLFNSQQIARYYPAYHTYDIVQAAERMLEDIGYDNRTVEQRSVEVMRRLLYEDDARSLIGQTVTVYRTATSDMLLNDSAFEGYLAELKTPQGEPQPALYVGSGQSDGPLQGKVAAILKERKTGRQTLVVCADDDQYSDWEIRCFVDPDSQIPSFKIIK